MEIKSSKVLVVGAGLTGALTCNFIRQRLKQTVSIEIWEKSRGVGGRMNSSRMNTSSNLSCDMGAQYLTVTKEYMCKHQSVYNELLNEKVLSPLEGLVDGMKDYGDQVKHYVAPRGLNAIPKYFIKKADCNLKTNNLLKSIFVSDSFVRASGINNSDKESFDALADVVILTIPIPQLLKIQGEFESLLEAHRSRLELVQYSSRYALGCFYPNLKKVENVNWCSKYIPDGSSIRFLSIDTKKRKSNEAEGTSIVAHASVPFSIEHFESRLDDVEVLMKNRLYEIIPSLPKAESTKFLRWRYSQVTQPYEGRPGCIVLKSSPLIICAGDGFSNSNFDGCVDSAEAVLKVLHSYYS
ncbi:renalase [Hydra vulgaris]|uniref:Renalase n=1 Tax=Hydra vulgaris TaxID=6087 RepID=A0ABM4BQR7_HYDVU